jgi:2'-5' RNA ligase
VDDDEQGAAAKGNCAVRLFVGVKISMAAVDAIAAAVERMREAARDRGVRVRWLSPAAYHVTLKFLGEARPEALDAVRDALGAALAGADGLAFRTRGAGAFPDPARARVVWVGVDDGGRLAKLAAACERAVVPLGFAAERRGFHPHVTIGRLREVANVEPVLLGCTEQEYSETRADRVTLFESIMKSSGSEYAVRAEFPLRQTGRVERASADRRHEHGPDPGKDP